MLSPWSQITALKVGRYNLGRIHHHPDQRRVLNGHWLEAKLIERGDGKDVFEATPSAPESTTYRLDTLCISNDREDNWCASAEQEVVCHSKRAAQITSQRVCWTKQKRIDGRVDGSLCFHISDLPFLSVGHIAFRSERVLDTNYREVNFLFKNHNWDTVTHVRSHPRAIECWSMSV